MLVNIDSEVICDYCPNSYVELSLVVQKWLLNVFLYHPKRVLLVFLKDKLRNISHILEYFDASSLIE